MWLITPDLSFNLDHYKSFWAQGGSDVFLHLVPVIGNDEDRVRFDHPLSAIRAFDALMSGLSRGCRTVFVQEVYIKGDDEIPSLRISYDKEDYMTMIASKSSGEATICDPRTEPMKIYAPPPGLKS